MNTKILFIASLVFLSFSSCKGKSQRQKEQAIGESISLMKKEMDSIKKLEEPKTLKPEKEETETPNFKEKLKSKLLGTSPGDSIIGVWEVKNDYYMAIYEIVKYEDQYYGKMHYYNDGETEIEAGNSEDDYFLDDLYYKDGQYTRGTMHMPDGKSISAKFSFQTDTIKVEMTLDGYPYTEKWIRKKYEQK